MEAWTENSLPQLKTTCSSGGDTLGKRKGRVMFTESLRQLFININKGNYKCFIGKKLGNSASF